MAEWIYFIHPPRADFAETMTAQEKTVFRDHYRRLAELTRAGIVVLAGPTLGSTNTGIVVFEAPDEAAARTLMEADPVFLAGIGRAELRPFEVSLLRGRDA